jgi:hypothetical protein
MKPWSSGDTAERKRCQDEFSEVKKMILEGKEEKERKRFQEEKVSEGKGVRMIFRRSRK